MRLKPRWWALLAVLLFVTLSSAQQGCSSTSPCTVGCCSKFGFCGFGPESVALATAPPPVIARQNAGVGCPPSLLLSLSPPGASEVMGFGTNQSGTEYAPAGKQTCPLNVCCSQWGFCGTTADFCGTGCQNGCGTPSKK